MVQKRRVLHHRGEPVAQPTVYGLFTVAVGSEGFGGLSGG